MQAMGADAAKQFNIHEAKTQLSRIIERVEKGEQIIISRAGVPVAKVVPLPKRANRRGRGSLAGQIEMLRSRPISDWGRDHRQPTAPRHPCRAVVAGR
jgi:prevent-host-death family protein